MLVHRLHSVIHNVKQRRICLPPRDSGEGGPSVARSAKDGGRGAGLDGNSATTTARQVRRPLHHPSGGPLPRYPPSRSALRRTQTRRSSPSERRRVAGADEWHRSRDAVCIRVVDHASRRLASNGREAISLLPEKGRRSAERRIHFRLPRRLSRRSRAPFSPPSPACGGGLGRGHARLSALLPVMRRDFTPDSAWAALPGITGSRRENPLRHQCSERQCKMFEAVFSFPTSNFIRIA
jgi:hypothetical protein